MTPESRHTTAFYAVLTLFLTGCLQEPVTITYRVIATPASSPAGGIAALVFFLVFVSICKSGFSSHSTSENTSGAASRELREQPRPSYITTPDPPAPSAPTERPAASNALRRAHSAIASGAYGVAYCLATKLIESDSGDFDALRIRDVALSKLAQPPACSDSERIDGNNAAGLRRTAVQHIGAGDYHAALCAARRLLALSPDDEHAARIERTALRHLKAAPQCDQ